MKNFQYCQPTTLDEAIALLCEYGDDAKVLAGGQSLVLLLREGLVQPSVVINLLRISHLDCIEFDEAQQTLEIGALATHRQVERSERIWRYFPFFPEAYQTLASAPVRNLGTLGGNLCHNAPGSDPPALLVALDATVTLVGPNGERVVKVLDFGTDYYTTALQPGEILTKVSAPVLPPRSGVAYYKYAIRPMDMAIVGVAARVTLKDDCCQDVRVALTGVAPTTIRARRTEAALEGQVLTEALIADAAELASESVDAVSDIHGSAEFRRRLTRPAVRRMLHLAWQRAAAQ